MNNVKTFIRPKLYHKTSRYCISFLSLLCLLVGQDLYSQLNQLSITSQAERLNCFGDSNGQVAFSVSGGTPPYTYAWTQAGNTFVFASGQIASENLTTFTDDNFFASTFYLQIADAVGNTARDTIQIIEPLPLQIAEISVTDPSCQNTCDGSIILTTTGGTGVLSTSWSDTNFSSDSRDNLCAGSYVFILSDENACTQKGLIDLFAPDPIIVNANTTNPTCAGASNGEIAVFAAGGVGEYRYDWENMASTSAVLSNRAAGVYALSVYDENDCSLDTAFTLSEGPTLESNIRVNYGCGDGGILVSTQARNGNAPYTFSWSTGQTSPVLSNMSAGSYSLSLTDVNGCAVTTSFEVNYVAPLSVAEQVRHVSCADAQDGSIELDIMGGSPPFSINWDTGASANFLDNLSGGTYLYNLSAGACGIARTVQVIEPESLDVYVIFSPQTNNLLTGTAVVTGGTSPYFFNWSTGQIDPVVTNLLPGNSYQISVTDASGCAYSVDVAASLTGLQDDLRAEQFVLFPNPSMGQVYLQSTLFTDKSLPFILYNAIGQTVKQGIWATNTPLDIKNLPAGTYFLSCWINGQLMQKTVIKI